MSIGPKNRAPSAARFQRAVQTIGDLNNAGPSFASIGAGGGATGVLFEGLKRAGQALVNQDIQQQAVQVQKAATLAGQGAASQALSDGGQVQLRQDNSLAADAFNKSLQTSYLENIDLNLRSRTLELAREHAKDPTAFAKAYDAEAAAMKAKLPESWQPAFDRVSGQGRLKVLDRLTSDAVKKAAGEANATHMTAADTHLADMANALRSGDVSTATEARSKALAANEARTDLTPLQKAQNAQALDKEWQRQSVLGSFEGELKKGPQAGSDFITAFQNSETIKNPDLRAKIAGEMSAHLQDVINNENAQAKEADAKIKMANAQALSALEINVSRGAQGYVEINAADQAGVFAFDAKARTRIYKAADKAAQARQDKARQVALGAAFVTGERAADPKNKADRKAASDYFQANIAPNFATMNGTQAAAAVGDFVKSTGIIPEQIKSGLRAALSGGAPETVAWASDVIARIEESKPQALDAFAKQDIALAGLVNQFVRAGVDPLDAVARAREAVDPTKEAVRKARRDIVKADQLQTNYASWVGQSFQQTSLNDFVPWGPSNDVAMSGTSQEVQVTAEFGTLFEDWYARTGDKAIAKKNALRELHRTWGASSVNGSLQVMKYAPEAYYGVESTGLAGQATNADTWIRDQLIGAVQAAGLWNTQTDLKDRVHAVADAQTAREASNGKPTYSVVVMDANGVYQPLMGGEGKPQRWRPDRAAHVKVLNDKKKKEARGMRSLGMVTGPGKV